MQRTIIVGTLIVGLAVLVAALVLPKKKATPAPQSTETSVSSPTPQATQTFVAEQFENIKSAHYVSSEPANNALLTTAPTEVKINFNFTLAAPSKISVTDNSGDVTTGPIVISPDKKTLSVPVHLGQTGNYKVTYSACWPDTSCHDGSFGFSVKSP